MIAVQKALSPDELPVGIGLLTFSQMMGGAIGLAVAEAIFLYGLRQNLAQYAPTADADAVIAAGATAFRSVVSEAELPLVLVAYSKSINWVFYLAVGFVAVSFVASFGVGWKNIKKEKDNGAHETD